VSDRMRFICVLAMGWVLAGCGDPEPDDQTAAQAMQIELQGVTVRQDHGSRARFEFRARKVVLSRERQDLVARGEVRGRLEPGMWKRGRN
jgi:hypothetical protein